MLGIGGQGRVSIKFIYLDLLAADKWQLHIITALKLALQHVWHLCLQNPAFHLFAFPHTYLTFYSFFLSCSSHILLLSSPWCSSHILFSEYSHVCLSVLQFAYIHNSFCQSTVPLSISTTWPFSSPGPLHLSLSGLALSNPCFSCGSIQISPFLCLYKHALFVFPSAALLCFATSRQSCWQRWARAYLKCHWKSDKGHMESKRLPAQFGLTAKQDFCLCVRACVYVCVHVCVRVC